MRTLKMLIGTAVIFMIGVGCQQKESSKRSQRSIGRTAQGTVGVNSDGTPAPLNPSSMNTSWGEIVGENGDQSFLNELQVFTYPALSGASQEDQLGYVSSASGQSTGVRFWGVVKQSNGLTGTVDPNSSQFHLEIYDSKYGTKRSDGTTIEPYALTIGKTQGGFKNVKSTSNGTSAQLTFESEDTIIYMDGTFQNQYYVGRIQYYNSATGGQYRVLGRFTVQKCGFFVCQ